MDKKNQRPMIKISLRRATADDGEFAYQTKKVAFRPYVEMVWKWDDAEQRHLHERRFAEQEFKVIQVSGVDVGILAVVREPGCLRVNQMFIRPEYQNRGIGEACMRKIIEDAENEGMPVGLRVLKVNWRAIAFYRRMGFEETGESDTHLLMIRKLP
jgi:ribosomal protein S18 acetylase RimI-like enzyme